MPPHGLLRKSQRFTGIGQRVIKIVQLGIGDGDVTAAHHIVRMRRRQTPLLDRQSLQLVFQRLRMIA